MALREDTRPARLGRSPEGRSLEEADLTDRQRLAVVLEGVAWLAHRARAGRPPIRDWEGAVVDPEGHLHVDRGDLGRGDGGLPPQALASRLLRRLFGTPEDLSDRVAGHAGSLAGRIAGRGEARRAARVLLEEWSQELVPVPPDRLVEQVLDEARFLWSPAFADSRRRLVADGTEPGAEPYVAGPRRWRERVVALAADREELEDLVAGELGRELWQAVQRPGFQSEVQSSKEDAEAARPPVERAWDLYRRGSFEAALDVLAQTPFEAGAVLRAGCHCFLGQYEAARRMLGRLEELDVTPLDEVRAGEIAARVLHGLERPDAAAAWVMRALEVTRGKGGPLQWRAELLAAFEAWDRGDPETMETHLEAARPALEVPELAWRWHHGAGLLALARAESAAALDHLRRALGLHRRGLARVEAGEVWNDVGVARAQTGDLAGAERAFLHCLRLYESCDGPYKVTVALQNLAEIRLRRGRSGGTRKILERASAATRRSGNLRAQAYGTALWARYELVQGRPEAALTLCRDALESLEPVEPRGEPRHAEGDRAELGVLAARALGWLERSEEAAETLAAGSPRTDPRAVLEPEEIAPLWALAGDRDRALREIAEPAIPDPSRGLWQRLLTGRPAPAERWTAVEELEPFRFARCVFDAEMLFPGQVPVDLRRRAVAVFRRLGASWLAERLEARDTGPWESIASYLGRAARGFATDGTDRIGEIEELFARAGYPQIRLWWEGSERAQVLVDGVGGERRLTAPCSGGRLVLTAAADPEESEAGAGAVLEALLWTVTRDFVPRGAVSGSRSPTSRGGMIGESEAFLKALERLERFAPSELSVVVCGESGTGKELAARYLHRRSARAEAPFVALNCAALSETLQLSELFGHVRGAFTGADRDRAGMFETAQGGTVFLDEIGDLAASGQGMLLRVLQEGEVRRVGESLPRKVDVRVVAATHRDLEERVREGGFREDLFYRLRGAQVLLPPLRDRGRDVERLAEHLLQQHTGPSRRPFPGDEDGASPPRLTAAARRALRAHAWPGNVRELQNVLGTAAALATDGAIEPEHLDLPRRTVPAGDYHQQVESFRRRLVEEALAAAGGNRSEAARRLGLTRQALSYLVRRFDL